VSLLLLLNQPGGGATNYTQTSADALAAVAEAIVRAKMDKARADGDALATVADSPSRRTVIARREHRPTD